MLLKLQPYRQTSVQRRVSRKLFKRYFSLFPILHHISSHEQRKWFHVSQLRYYHGIDPNSEVVPILENIIEEASSKEEVEHTQTQRGRGSETHMWKLNVNKVLKMCL